MEFKGTKGEWEALSLPYVHIKNSDLCIADCDQPNIHSEALEANAKLIAAAPELLDALKSFVNNGFQIPSNTDIEESKKAIEKALK